MITSKHKRVGLSVAIFLFIPHPGTSKPGLCKSAGEGQIISCNSLICFTFHFEFQTKVLLPENLSHEEVELSAFSFTILISIVPHRWLIKRFNSCLVIMKTDSNLDFSLIATFF